MKLYELTQNYTNLVDLLENPEVPQEIILEAIKSVQDDLNVKLESLVMLVKSIEKTRRQKKEFRKQSSRN